VNKTRDESDKRIIRLSLSDKGKQITEDSFAGINQLNQELFASLDEEEKKVLTSAFKKIVESIEGGNQ
jgi:DNA-binding MarR family transcriptional regulator